MLYPCIEQLVTDKSCQCRYSLVIAVAKRARQIAEMKAAEGEKLEDRAVSLAGRSFADHEVTFAEDRKHVD